MNKTAIKNTLIIILTSILVLVSVFMIITLSKNKSDEPTETQAYVDTIKKEEKIHE